MAHESGVILALDQGTTSSRTMAIALDGTVVATAQAELPQIYPHAGWVEHSPVDIWETQLQTAGSVMAQLQGRRVLAIGIANQRETTIIWDRKTGAPIHNAIVWQDRRTADVTRNLAEDGHEARVSEKTGLVLDPYFSASKIAWILDNVDGARARAEKGELAFGTVDSWLVWKLTGGRVHATDATNAARTSLFDIQQNVWDDDLCALFRVPRQLLPGVRDCADDFGETTLLGSEIPIRGLAGDQHAALVGQACLSDGDVKSTYGTGAFLILNTGQQLVRSSSRLLSTIAFRVHGQTSFALEGSILSAGATIQWLRDGLGIIKDGAEAGTLAASIKDTGGVYLVPAFTGLGAPHWQPDARGALIGLSRGTDRRHIARAGLEAAAYQTNDLFAAMSADGAQPATLKVDGGMAANDWLMQFMADVLGVDVVRPRNTETTALGAAILAAVGVGEFSSLTEATSLWALDRRFEPAAQAKERSALIDGWGRAVQRVLPS